MANQLIPAPGGAPRLVYGWDGTDWRALLVDAAGNLQIDVAASALPAGAATEATLADLLTELGQKLETNDLLIDAGGRLIVVPQAFDGIDYAEFLLDAAGHLQVDVVTAPSTAATIADGADVTQGALADAMVAAGAAGTVSAKLRRLTTDLSALLTELALKADLTETQPVSAVALPLPAGAATAAHQVTQNTSLALIEKLEKALESVATDCLQVRGEDQLFSFDVVVANRVVDTISGAGGMISSGAVPAGKVWVLTNVWTRNDNTAGTAIRLFAYHNAQEYLFSEFRTGLGVSYWLGWSGELFLDAGDVVQAYFDGSLATDTVRIEVTGYQMTVET